MKKSSFKKTSDRSGVSLVLHSKPVIIAFSVLVITVLALLAIKLITKIQNDAFEKQLAKEMSMPPPQYDRPLTEADVKCGKYYLNGDKNSDYFIINEDDTIELCSEDPYSVFEKIYDGNTEEVKEKAIADDIKVWSEPRHFTTEVYEMQNIVMLKTDLFFSETDHSYIGSGGPMLIDVDTLQWGAEEKYIYIPD